MFLTEKEENIQTNILIVCYNMAIGDIEIKRIITCTSPYTISHELSGFTLQPQL